MNIKARGVPEINLDEFERRLRSAGASTGAVEDPLAELTRLVNSMAAGQHVDNVVDFSSVRLPRAEPFFTPPPAFEPPVEPEPLPPVEVASASDALDAGIEEELRRAVEETQNEAPDYALASEAPLGDEVPVEATSARSKGWHLKVGALTGIGLLLATGAIAFKFVGVPGLPKAPLSFMRRTGL